MKYSIKGQGDNVTDKKPIQINGKDYTFESDIITGRKGGETYLEYTYKSDTDRVRINVSIDAEDWSFCIEEAEVIET